MVTDSMFSNVQAQEKQLRWPQTSLCTFSRTTSFSEGLYFVVCIPPHIKLTLNCQPDTSSEARSVREPFVRETDIAFSFLTGAFAVCQFKSDLENLVDFLPPRYRIDTDEGSWLCHSGSNEYCVHNALQEAQMKVPVHRIGRL